MASCADSCCSGEFVKLEEEMETWEDGYGAPKCSMGCIPGNNIPMEVSDYIYEMALK